MKSFLSKTAPLLWVFFMIFFYMGRTIGNSITFKRLTVTDGLSQGSIYDIHQDSKGLMWFGTRGGGLNRYDGYSFHAYKNIANDTISIGSDHIYCITEDKDENLWIGTKDGLTKYDYNQNSFSHYFPVNQPLESISNIIISIIIDNRNTIWLGTRDGLFSFNQATNQFTKHFEGTKIKNIQVNHIHETENGDLWIGTEENGLIYYPIADGNYKQFKHDAGDPKSISGNIVKTIFEDHNNNLWVGGTKFQKLIDQTTGVFETIDFSTFEKRLDNIIVWAITEGNQDELWLGTTQGLISYNTKNGSFRLFQNDPTNPKSLSMNSIYAITKDSVNNIWIGTAWGGVNLVEKQTHFEWYQFLSNESINLRSYLVSSIFGDEDQIWVGTEQDGIVLFDIQKRRFQTFENELGMLKNLSQFGVRAGFIDLDRNVWYGTNGGLNRFDPKEMSFERFIMPLNVTAIEQTIPGELWIGSSTGLYLFDIQAKEHYLVQDRISSVNLSNKFIKNFLVDGKKRLWIGTANEGIILYDLMQDIFVLYKMRGSTSGLSANTITSICEDNEGDIWAGTQNGIFKYDPQTDQFLYSDFNNLLPDLQIKAILSADHAVLWISLNQGIVRLNPETSEFRIYGPGDGLQDSEFIEGSCLKTSEGEMLFGGLNGLNVFHPDRIYEDDYSAPLIFTDFKIEYQSRRPGDKDSPLEHNINETKALTLGYNQNSFSFDFTALDYHNSDKIQYSYFLEGFDQEWVLAQNNRSASYTNIPPGNYTFRVKKTNSYGIWDKETRSINILVKPPFWKTTFAIVLYGILFVFMLLLFRKITIFRIEQKNLLEYEKKEKERIKELNNMKLRFFTNISHEFRTPLSLIIGPIDKLISSFENIQEQSSLLHIIKRNGLILQRLINELMDFRKLETGNMKLNLRKSDINSFVANNCDSFKIMANEKAIDFNIQIPSKKEDVYFDGDKLLKILYNLLSNSFKYTPGNGKVSLTVSTSAIPENESLKNELIVISKDNPLNEFIELVVEDDGHGISADQLPKIFDRYYQAEEVTDLNHPGSGIGLTVVKNLVSLMGGDILVSSEKGVGTRFAIRLPIIREYALEESVSETFLAMDDEMFTPECFSEESGNEETIKTGYSTSQPLGSDKKYRILIVEDNSDLRAFLKDSLSEQYLIAEAVDGEEGLCKAREIFPDIILSDVVMPKMSGIELCEKVKTDTLTSHIPFILLTARTTLEHTLEGLETGADLYIPKPFNIHLILIQIQNLIKSREALRQRFKKESFLQPSEITVTSIDEKFLIKAKAYIEEHISDENFNVKTLHEEMAMSRSNLQLKIKALTGLSPNEYIRTIRLNRAARLLAKSGLTIVEVAYETGFNSPSYFSKCFKKQFHMSPNEYINCNSNT